MKDKQSNAQLRLFYQQHAARNHRAVVLWLIEQGQEQEQTYSDILHALQQHNSLFAHQIGNFRNFLGSEQSILYYDTREHWHANTLVGLSATLVGQGLFLLAVSTHSWQSPSWQHWLTTLAPEHYFICQDSKELLHFLTSWPYALKSFLPQNTGPQAVSLQITNYQATPAQQDILRALPKQPQHQAILLYAPRGRGKTATLAHWLSQTHSFARRFVCTPSKQQAALYLQQTPGVIFLPPDQIAKTVFHSNDLLLIDEAATLPVNGQNAVLHLPLTLVLATTTEGYEYAGRGFIIRFMQELQEHFPRLTSFHLQQPMRWAEDDPLEQANSQAFALYPNEAIQNIDPTTASSTTTKPPTVATCPLLTPEQSHYQIQGAALFSDQEKLAIFRLLVNAHYQTSPYDIQRLLDHSEQVLVTQWHQEQLQSVAWLSPEGPLPNALIPLVSQGKRRLTGQLLPQAYAYYGKKPALAQLKHVRVVRIATQPSLQGQGFGSALLAFIEQWAQQQGYHALGTSFGMNEELLRFWQKNNWQALRLGHKADPASRLPSAIFARPLTVTSQQLLNTLTAYLTIELEQRVRTQHISAPLAQALCTNLPLYQLTTAELQQRWQQLGRAFVNGQLNFLDYQPWLALAVDSGWLNTKGQQQLSCADYHYLLNSLPAPSNFSLLAQQTGLSGKKAALEKLQNICAQLHQ